MIAKINDCNQRNILPSGNTSKGVGGGSDEILEQIEFPHKLRCEAHFPMGSSKGFTRRAPSLKFKQSELIETYRKTGTLSGYRKINAVGYEINPKSTGFYLFYGDFSKISDVGYIYSFTHIRLESNNNKRKS